MTVSVHNDVLQDSLYGRVQLDGSIATLAIKPIVQRLRHVRLSNIDSLDIPGISNLSRYEHVLGVAHLAGEVSFRSKLSRFDDLVLKASALLHDWAITSFGHLVEEALQYVGTGFDHQERLSEIVSGETPEEIGGVSRQILMGRETGLPQWVNSVTHSKAEGDQLLADITQQIRGKGRFGRIISGDIDLDNIDSVFRMAYHMGLPTDRETPLRLARAIVDYDAQSGDPIFRRAAERDIAIWRSTRSRVYNHLMLSRRDFAGKLMILYATIRAFEESEITNVDWSMTDFDFIHRLLSSDTKDVKEQAERWIAGELWDLAPLQWMSGERPDYTRMQEFSRSLSARLARTCFVYAIRDKRDRRLVIRFSDGSLQTFGENPQQWLLGVGSPERRTFKTAESAAAFEFARLYFDTIIVGPAVSNISREQEAQPSLL